MKRVPFLLLFLLSSAIAQTLPQPDKERAPVSREGVITGRVIGEDGRPAKAMIEVHSTSSKTKRIQPVATDAEGNFKLTNLSPSSYALFPYVPGYIVDRRSRELDFHRIGEHVTLNLVKGGVITGRVTNVLGEPMVGVRVFPRLIRDLDGNRVSLNFERFDLTRMTDDRGIYRLFGLESGRYIVFIDNGLYPSKADKDRDAPLYYPSSSRETAAEIAVQSGQEVAGIDISYRNEPGHTVSGKVSLDSGSDRELDLGMVMMLNLTDGQIENGINISKSGLFEIHAISDGEYEIFAVQERGNRSLSASVPHRISVRGADVTGIELPVIRLGSISGRVTLESNGSSTRCPAATRSSIEEILLQTRSVRATKVDGLMNVMRAMIKWIAAGVDEKGEFKVSDLFPGNYQLIANLPNEDWFIRTITRSRSSQGANSRLSAAKPVDLSNEGLAVKPGEDLSGIEMKVAEGAASLSGVLVPGPTGAKIPKNIRIHLIPAEIGAANDLLRYSEEAVGSDGVFEFKHIAPGKYLLHTRTVVESEEYRPVAWDQVERAKLRREAEAAKNEIELQKCQHVKDYALRNHR